jgi:sulfoxide reductase heme-binding subunit YedZ
VIDHAYWYLVRSAGFSAYILLTFSMVWGLVLSNGFSHRLLAKPAVFEAHRVTSIFLLLLTAAHIVPLLFDSFTEWDAASLLVPFVSDYRPGWVGVGVLSLYLLVLLTASFYVRSRIGFRTWRALHFASFAAYLGATVHGLMAGSDSREPWALAVYGSSLALVLFLVNLRVLGGARVQRALPRRAPGPAAPRAPQPAEPS